MPQKSTRLVARLEVGQDWFPYGISEVVSHTDEQYVTVNVARSVRGCAGVLMREFDCRDAERCHAELRTWLQVLASEIDGNPMSVRAWSERIADAIVDGVTGKQLPGRPRVATADAPDAP